MTVDIDTDVDSTHTPSTDSGDSRSSVSSRLADRVQFHCRRIRSMGWRQLVPRLLLAAVLIFIAVWILFVTEVSSAHAAIVEPGRFLRTILDSITNASLYFIVASGFTLIFGLMRTVQMAHGSMFLLAGYIALEFQRNFIGTNQGLSPDDVSASNWLLPLVLAVLIVSGFGLVIQQVFLRWNAGQDLRQAIITIAISVIMADQMTEHFGGIAKDIAWTHWIHGFVETENFRYAIHRFFIIGVALGVGGLLWLLLKKTRTGLVIRAGVDDTGMVQALGINVQWVFAFAFVLGSALAALGGVIGGSQASLAPGVDAQWLLHSLVVVIIGGMGSLLGAAAGSLLYGLVTGLAPAYLPSGLTNYSIIATFAVLAIVLALRPYGMFGRAE